MPRNLRDAPRPTSTLTHLRFADATIDRAVSLPDPEGSLIRGNRAGITGEPRGGESQLHDRFRKSRTSLGSWTLPAESSLQGEHKAPSKTSFLSRPAQESDIIHPRIDSISRLLQTTLAAREKHTARRALLRRLRQADSTDFTHGFCAPFASAPSAFCGSPPSQALAK